MARKQEGESGRMTDWHRLFGLVLTDFFTDSPFVVEIEKDLSLMQQYLDVVILRKGKGRFDRRLPDGMDDLAEYNLLTFKSFQEALDDWALKELTGHYVNYRKQISPPRGALLPEGQFRLYAVCSRYPHNLASEVPLEEVQAGVYQCRRGTDRIRVIVVRQLPLSEHNAPLHLFSGSAEQVAFAAKHYRQQSEETSTLLHQLFREYGEEGLNVPYTMQDFQRDFRKQFLAELTPKERVEGLSSKDRVEGLTPEERVEGLTPEERMKGMSPEQLESLLQRLREEEAAPRQKKAGRKGRSRPKP